LTLSRVAPTRGPSSLKIRQVQSRRWFRAEGAEVAPSQEGGFVPYRCWAWPGTAFRHGALLAAER